MARANAASAFLRSPRVQGLAQTLSSPSYRLLLRIEPLSHRAVPILIIVFLSTLGVAGLLQSIDARQRVLTVSGNTLETVAALIEARLSAANGPRDAQVVLDRLPAPAEGAVFAVTGADGALLASVPHRSPAIEALVAATQAARPAANGLVRRLDVSGNGILAVALPLRSGTVLALRPERDILAPWWNRTAVLTLFMTTAGATLLMLGFAYHWQAARARRADDIYNTARSRLETALSHGRTGLWNWDLDSGLVYWSDSLFAMLGYVPRDDLLLDTDIEPLMHAEDGGFDAFARDMRATPAPATIDRRFRMRTAQGGWLCLRARGELVTDADTGAKRLVGIVVDETEERDLAERAERADARLHDAIEALSEAFVVWDAANELVICNSRFRALHRLPDGLARPGMPYRTLLQAGLQPQVRRQSSAATGADERGARTFEAQLDDGRWLTINERRTRDGGYVSVGTDITALKQQQAQLLDSERRLIATVADLKASRQGLERQTHQLAELAEKYAREKVLAVAGNRAKSAFLANISHELRTPLNAIIGFSQMMEDATFGPLANPRYEGYCRDIRRSGSVLLDFVNDVLEVSRIESGEFEVMRERFTLDPLIGEVMRAHQRDALAKALQIDLVATGSGPVDADRRALRLIVRNLVSNAVKFTPAGGRIGLRSRHCGDRVRILVTDTGIGIPLEAISKLGQPFEQVQGQFTKSHGGTGLGLWIARSLAALHGGSLRIRSRTGVGTAVLVTIPFAHPQAGEAARPLPPAALTG